MTSETSAVHISFLIGAGRSGTTLLYKLLCLHSEIAYISNYEDKYTWLPSGLACKFANKRLKGKVESWFNSGNAYFMRRPWAKKIFPTPNEGESVYSACGLPANTKVSARPDNKTLSKLLRRFTELQMRSKASVFLTKRTANNRRIKMLDTMFPDAKFIHLIRDGREVAQSLSQVEWWDNHSVWWDGRTPLQMESGGEKRLAVCARNWVAELDAIESDLKSIDPARTLVLRYEELLRDPMGTLKRVLDYLGLDLTEEYSNAIKSLNLQEQSPKWRKVWNESELEQVLQEEHRWLEKLNYTSSKT